MFDVNQSGPYASHLPILRKLFAGGTIKKVFEFGMGRSSTPFLLNHCDSVISIEMQSGNYYNEMLSEYSCVRWQPHLILDMEKAVDAILEIAEIDLVLVDGHGSNRFAQVQNAMRVSPIVVAHDTEEPSYRWDRIRLPNGWECVTYETEKPWTSVYRRVL
jgi:hypothetical protein